MKFLTSNKVRIATLDVYINFNYTYTAHCFTIKPFNTDIDIFCQSASQRMWLYIYKLYSATKPNKQMVVCALM